MKRFTVTLAIAAVVFALALMSTSALAIDDGVNEYFDTHAMSSDMVVSAPGELVEFNNDEGVASYAAPGSSLTPAMLQRITPAAGGGLSMEQLEDWELHRLQRFYNGENGVTK